MKDRMKSILKNKKIVIIVIFLIIFISIFLFIYLNKITIKEYENDKYTLKYDSSWQVHKNKDKVLLKHGKSKVLVQVITLNDNDRFLEISDMSDKILYDIEKQNSEYKLLKKEKKVVTKQRYAGYQALYENEKKQAMVTMAKSGDKLIIFTYESPNTDFDILLDSVSNIIYNFQIENEKFDLTTKLELKFTETNFSENEDISKLIDKTANYQIASNNYLVNYSIPKNFELTSINSSTQSFTFAGLSDYKQNISLNTNILNRNIYEYLDKDKSGSVFSNYSSYKKQNKDFKEEINKLDNKTFIYKNTYDKIYENVILMYELDKNHIFYVTISSRNIDISKEIIDSIKINKFENYSVYTDSKIENNQLISELKYFNDYKNDKMKVISFKLPSKFKEEQKSLINNIYQTRFYGLDYDEKLEINDYDLEIEVTGNKEESYIKVLNESLSTNDTYGPPKQFKKIGNKEVNGKTFTVYEGGYYGLAGTFFTSINRVKYFKTIKLLIYNLGDGKNLVISVSGNGKQISDDLLKEVTNFNIDVKEI